MTVRQDPLQHYPFKIASERWTVKRKQETSVRAGKQRFTAEDAEGAEDRKSGHISWLPKNKVQLVVRDEESGMFTVPGKRGSSLRDQEFSPAKRGTGPRITACPDCVKRATPANRTRISASALIILRDLRGLCGERLIDAQFSFSSLAISANR
jgi:hypothetical protein